MEEYKVRRAITRREACTQLLYLAWHLAYTSGLLGLVLWDWSNGEKRGLSSARLSCLTSSLHMEFARIGCLICNWSNGEERPAVTYNIGLASSLHLGFAWIGPLGLVKRRGGKERAALRSYILPDI